MISITVNGDTRQIDVAPDTPLLWVLRDTLGLTGTKYGCGMAQCGACMVHLDGQVLPSCITPVSAVGDRKITTIEGVSGKTAEALQGAWTRLDVPQCGYCQSGQVMAAIALLGKNSKPSDDDIDAALAGNVCRCATYNDIRAAIHAAARTLEG